MTAPNKTAAGSIPKPSADHIDAATRALCRDAMIEIGDTFASLGTSLAEAAWRDSPGGARLHLLQCREALRTGADVLRSWESSQAEAAP